MANHAIAQHVAALCGIPSQPTARPAVKPGYRLVPVAVGREGNVQTAYLPCPSWCVTDHSERVSFIEDVNHEGERCTMSLSPSRGEGVPVEVYLSQWPAARDEHGQPCLAVDLDYEVATYGRTAALAMADQLVAFAADVRRLAQTLPEDRPVREEQA
ncbi:hypothetical protein AB0L04_00025 [Streptomyces glaucescens]|uniref:DUF6907 domain-containing protein n=1 Tax=Streptomyces glaucescens TaxID=1907 RepID=UPI00344C98E2